MTTIAIQGIRGSYSEEAVSGFFRNSVHLLECASFADTFDAIRLAKADCAVVPVKNRIVGEITATTKPMREMNAKILDELRLEIDHVLVGTKDSSAGNLKTVRSHAEALKQCRKFLAKNKHLEQIDGTDTASSVRRVIEENDSRSSAIGSRRAADIYGAKILAENIADEADNWTIFYLIGK